MNNNKIVKYLICPCCLADMAVSDDGKSLFCSGMRRHCFDFSSKGYVNFAGSRGVTGDSKAAVGARTEFLNKGYYEPIANMLVDILKKYKLQGLVVDAGCGEGYYTQRIHAAGYQTLGLDLSKFGVHTTASRLKCNANDSAFACVSSIFEMPLREGSADAVVSIFAPCAESEIARVLADDGIMVVVAAGKEHLMGLKKALYENVYENDVRADMPEGMTLLEENELRYSATIEGNADILNLFSMTPYYFRTSVSDREKLLGFDMLETDIDIKFSVYKKESL